MSIKIYDGFRLPHRSLESVLACLSELRTHVRLDARDRAEALACKDATAIIDADATATCLSRPRPEGAQAPLSHVMGELYRRSRNIEIKGLRDPEVDFGMEISLFAEAGHVYGIIHTEQADWARAWMRISGAEDFGYWNNSDPAQGVSREEWETRGATWRSLLAADPAGRPGYAGLAAPVHGSRIPRVDMKDVLSHQVDLATRARDLALDAMRGRSLAQELGPGLGGSTSLLIRSLTRFNDWVRTEAGAAELEAEISRLQPLLPAPLTEGHLLRGLEKRGVVA